MILNYAYTPYIWPSVLTVLLLVVLSIYCVPQTAILAEWTTGQAKFE